MLESRGRGQYGHITPQAGVLGLEALDLGMFLAGHPGPCAGVDLARRAHRRTVSVPSRSCFATAAAAAVNEMNSPRPLQDPPDHPLLHSRINILWHDAILPDSKDSGIKPVPIHS